LSVSGRKDEKGMHLAVVTPDFLPETGPVIPQRISARVERFCPAEPETRRSWPGRGSQGRSPRRPRHPRARRSPRRGRQAAGPSQVRNACRRCKRLSGVGIFRPGEELQRDGHALRTLGSLATGGARLGFRSGRPGTGADTASRPDARSYRRQAAGLCARIRASQRCVVDRLSEPV